MLLAALLLGLASQSAPEEPLASFRGEFRADDAVVATDALGPSVAPGFPARGPSFPFVPAESGPHRFELRSFGAKPYLVVRDAAGAVIGEDEYSLWGILPRVTAELVAGASYRVEAASRCGLPGAFELAVYAGAAPAGESARDAAFAFAREGLRELEARGRPADAELGTALHRLGFVSVAGGELAPGVEFLRRALAVRDAALGDHPLTAETCLSLGAVLHQSGDADGALPLFQRALAIEERVFGPEHPATAAAARNLGMLFETRDELQAAEPLYARALRIDETALGPEARDTMLVRARLAATLHRRGELDRARELYERELEIRERVGGGRDPESARVLEAIGAIHGAQGRPAEQRELLERALARLEATVGPDHRDTAGVLAVLGVLLKAGGELERGGAMIERALAIDPAVHVPEVVLVEAGGGWWNAATARWWQLVWVGLSAALFARALRRRRARLATPRTLHVLAVVVSLLTYVNFGAFQFGSFVHRWDAFHYYVGAKYFEELRYDGLYDAVVVADSETPGWSERNASRQVRDLRTNAIVGTERLLADPDAVKRRFTPERWREFCADVARFRDREPADRWEQTTTDHGYNATPVWGMAGGLLAELVEPTDAGLAALASIDLAYLAALAAALVWGFGLELAALALAGLATFFPAHFGWTGGAILRWDWLFFTAAALACLRRGKPRLAGLALAYASLLRVFPALVFAGPALAWLAARRAGRREEAASYARFFGGAALAVLVLVPVGFVTGGGPSAWAQFAANSAKHQETPLANHMGLRTVLTWRPDATPRSEAQRDDQTFWDAWRASRAGAWRTMRFVNLALVAAWIAALYFAVRGREPWLAAALSLTLIPVAVELTCYYLAFVPVLAVVAERRPRAGFALLALSALSLAVSLAPLPGMTRWEDRQFVELSLATLAALGVVLASFVAREPAAPAAAKPADR